METKKIIRKDWWGGIVEYEVNRLGQKHGQYKRWWSNGNIAAECTYQNGERYGLFKLWWDNGTIDYINTQKKSQRFGTMIQFKYKKNK